MQRLFNTAVGYHSSRDLDLCSSGRRQGPGRCVRLQQDLVEHYRGEGSRYELSTDRASGVDLADVGECDLPGRKCVGGVAYADLHSTRNKQRYAQGCVRMWLELAGGDRT